MSAKNLIRAARAVRKQARGVVKANGAPIVDPSAGEAGVPGKPTMEKMQKEIHELRQQVDSLSSSLWDMRRRAWRAEALLQVAGDHLAQEMKEIPF